MAMSTDPGRAAPEAEPEHQTELADMVAAMDVAPAKEASAANGVKNGGMDPPAKRAPQRPVLSNRKLSLQERGTYLGAGGGAYSHISPRVARRPTIESKRVSISDAQVSFHSRDVSVRRGLWRDQARISVKQLCAL